MKKYTCDDISRYGDKIEWCSCFPFGYPYVDLSFYCEVYDSDYWIDAEKEECDGNNHW